MQSSRISVWRPWNMSFAFFGIQFDWGLQMAYMTALCQYLGAEESDIAFLWPPAPPTGLIVHPSRSLQRLNARSLYLSEWE